MKQNVVATINTTPNTTNETKYNPWTMALIWVLPLIFINNKPIKRCGSILWMLIGVLFTAKLQEKKIDPLTRIQEEIKEVVRREQEYRQLTSVISQNEQENETQIETETDVRAAIEKINRQDLSTDVHTPLSILSVQDVSLSNTPSLSPSIASKDESLDETHHSDDSGISASSSPINGTSAYVKNDESIIIKNAVKPQRYIGPNCYNLTPKTPVEKTMTRTVSTPHLATKTRPINLGPAQKGVMQRFIASRGKLQLNKQGLGTASTPLAMSVTNTPTTLSPLSSSNVNSFLTLNAGERQIANAVVSPPVIERDAEGRPIRRGYVPVELKIQRELKDLKSRESELKKIRKIRQSTPDLLNSIDNENVETDEDEDVEHCYGPGQLRSAKSITELCDSAQSNNSSSPRGTPSPDFEHKFNGRSSSGGMKPAVSLAQLCDLDPQEAPSCHSLIAKWESLTQQEA